MPLRAPKGFIDETDPKVCQIGHPAPPWLVNYADLMTELVCFFVILYALSAALNKGVQKAADDIKKQNDPQVKSDIKKDGLEISVEEKEGSSFFTSGSAETTPQIDEKVAQIAPILKKLAVDHEVIVQGHTDSQRISNQFFDSNWELSTARATAITRLLIEKYGFPAQHMGSMGYGEFRPIASNLTPEGRAKNRRIVFFIPSKSLTKTPPVNPAALTQAGGGVEGRARAAGPGAPSPTAPASSETPSGEKPVVMTSAAPEAKPAPGEPVPDQPRAVPGGAPATERGDNPENP